MIAAGNDREDAAMARLTLYIGNKNYSSWSLRPWLAMKTAGIGFDEKLIPLFDENWPAAVAAVSPTRKVPVLHVETDKGALALPETLAILEYAAELKPELWPEDKNARALARAVSAEMHAGFTALRSHMPMNMRKDLAGKGMGPGVADDIARIVEIWRDCRARFGQGGAFLFGRFSNADAMFAPVVSRFATYAPDLPDDAKAYMAAVQDVPAMQDWSAAARAEPWLVAEDEIG
jgi:glutathione S-transferase